MQDPIAPQPSHVRAVLERHFTQGLEFVAQGFKQMTKLNDRMGPGSQPAKKMLTEAMDKLVQALREFNVCIEHMRSNNRDDEINEANRLLLEYREELEEMRRKNKQLREIVAMRLDGRFPEDPLEDPPFASRAPQRPRTQNSQFNPEIGRVDDVTFGKRGRPGKIPEEMYRSNYTQNGYRSTHHDESVAEKHNKSWMSINLDRGLDKHFAKKEKPGLASQTSGSKSPKRLAELNGPGETRPLRDSHMKRSIPLAQTLGHEQELLRSLAAESNSKSLRDEITEIDKKIFEMVSHIFDQYHSEQKEDH